MYSSADAGGSVTTTFKRYNEHKRGENGGESSYVLCGFVQLRLARPLIVPTCTQAFRRKKSGKYVHC